MLHLRALAKGCFHAEPKLVFVACLVWGEEIARGDLAQFNGPFAQEIGVVFFGDLTHDICAQFVPVRPVFGLAHVAHRVLIIPPVLVDVKGCGHVENLLPVLDRNNPSGGETAAVTGAVDLIDHRNFRITGPDEIGVQRMAQTVGHGAVGGHKRLRDDMPAEDAGGRLAPAPDAAKQIDLKLFYVQQMQQFVGRGHVISSPQ